MVAQGVELSLKLRHAANVISQFLVDIFNAAVNVIELLCYLGSISNHSSRTYSSFGPLITSLPLSSSLSLGTLYSGPSWYPGRPRNSTFSPATLLALCSPGSSHDSPFVSASSALFYNKQWRIYLT